MARWLHTLNVSGYFMNRPEEMSFEQVRDGVVASIRSSSFYVEDDYELTGIVDGLEDSEDFDYFWNSFCDYADYYRIWVDTFGQRS